MSNLDQINKTLYTLNKGRKTKLSLGALKLLTQHNEDMLWTMVRLMTGLISHHNQVFCGQEVDILRNELVECQKSARLTQQELIVLFFDVFSYGGVEDIVNKELSILIKRVKIS